jgi:hypothetical protein
VIHSVADNSFWWRWRRRAADWSLAFRCLALALVVAAAYPVIGFLASQRVGEDGWLAALVAAGVCWFGSTVALVLTALLRGPQAALYSLLFGMLFRMGLPLAAGILLSQSSPRLAAGGVFGCMVGFYLVTLVAETLLSLPLVQGSAGPGRDEKQ